jgi:hypothetical protein
MAVQLNAVGDKQGDPMEVDSRTRRQQHKEVTQNEVVTPARKVS